MAETVQFKPEQELPPSEEHELLTAHAEHAGEALQSPEQNTDKLEEIRETVEVTSTPSQETQLPNEADPAQPSSQYIDKDLKTKALRQTLQVVRRQLPLPDRLLSRVVHQPVVRLVSQATGQTVARPSGLLGGGVCAFIGSLLYLYLTKHIGLAYNYYLFSLLFIVGFVVGVVIEFFVRLVRQRSH
ncbi:MAG TPA: hypothetical protein VNE40_01890 [Candidatus Dormibacteraeota bacterium]|nr:hypothetical protein [Candidatus Dormibacteraeota bacterium]